MPDENQATGQAAPDNTGVSDNVSPQPSEASEQLTNAAPEATQDNASAQEAEAPETNAEDNATKEALLAGKFKSPEDLEKGYRELESRFGREASEKAELARVLSESFSQPQPASPPVIAEEDNFTDDYEEQNPLNTKIEELERKTAVQTFILSHSDADASLMQKVLTEDPLVQQINGHEAKLEYAYLKSQGVAQQRAVVEAEKRGAETTQVKMAEKQVAQVEDAKKSAPISNKEDLMKRMKYGDKTARAEVIGNIPAVREMRKLAGLE